MLNRTTSGKEIIIAKAGRGIAKLAPVEAKTPDRKSGVDMGKVWISEDFDAPLPEKILKDFES